MLQVQRRRAEIPTAPAPGIRRRHMSDELKTGFCKYCGHAVMVPESSGKTQDEWDKEATKRCNCGESSRIRWKQCVLEQFREDIKRIELQSATRQYLAKGAELIADGILKTVTVKTDLDATVKISMKGSAIALKKVTQNTEEILSEGMYKQ